MLREYIRTLWSTSVICTLLITGALVVVGCATPRPRLTLEKLPDGFPECIEEFHYDPVTLRGKGPFNDRQLFCLQKGDGTYAWFELVMLEVK